MTPVQMSARGFKRLTKQIPLTGMSKSDLMHIHLLLVEAALGRRIMPDELRSARFTESRESFVSNMMSWKKGI